MKKKGITFLGSCPACGQIFKRRGTSVVTRSHEAFTVHADCEECLASALLTVQSSAKGFTTTVGLLTDLTKKDVRRVKNLSVISEEDVLDVHAYLEQ